MYADIPAAETGNALHDTSKVIHFAENVWWDIVVRITKSRLKNIGE
jgi:hypothetical protein